MNQSLLRNTIVILCVGIFIYLTASVLLPFILAGVIAYLGNPFVELLARRRVPRTIASLGLFLIFALVVISLFLLLIPVLYHQSLILLGQFNTLIDWVQANLAPKLVQLLGINDPLDFLSIKQLISSHLSQSTGVIKGLVASLKHSSHMLISMVMTIVLVPVVSFYLLRDWNTILLKIEGILPVTKRSAIVCFFRESDQVLAAFFKGQLLVMVALGVIYSVGLWLVGLKVALIIGMISGLVAIVPYLGFIVGIVSATIAAMIEFHQFNAVLLVWLVYAIGQCLESMVLTPNLVGDKIGLHPVVVIFSILVGEALFGFLGVLLALPVAAVIKVLLHHLLRMQQNKDGRNPCS